MRVGALLAVIVVCSGVFFSWQRWGQRMLNELGSSRTAATANSAPAPAPAPVPAIQPPPAEAAPPQSTESQAQQQPSTPASTPLAPQQQVASVPLAAARQTTPEPVKTAPAPIMKKPAPAQPDASGAAGTITIEAGDLCWIDGYEGAKHTVGMLMRAGDSKSIAATADMRLRLGSAGAVKVAWNGKALPSLGSKGETRWLEIKDGALTGSAPKAAAKAN